MKPYEDRLEKALLSVGRKEAMNVVDTLSAEHPGRRGGGQKEDTSILLKGFFQRRPFYLGKAHCPGLRGLRAPVPR